VNTGAQYKTSGVEWLDKIPSHWHVALLHTIAHESRFKNDGAKRPILSLSYGKIVVRDIKNNFGLLPESFDTYQVVKKGDTVLRPTDLQNDKTSLRTGYCELEGLITSAYISLRPRLAEIDAQYFAFQLHAYDLLKVLYAFGGGLRQTIRFEDIKRMPILIPPLEEQRAIVSFLFEKTKQINSLIDKQRRMIKLLREERQALINQAVTKGLDASVKLRPTKIEWLREVPEHWDLKKLSRVTNRIGDGLHGTPTYADDSDIAFVNGNNLCDGEIVITERTRKIPQSEYAKYKIDLGPRTVLMSINGTIGNVAFYKGEKLVLGKSACYIDCADELSPEFLYYLLQSDSTLVYFTFELTGSTINNLGLESIRQTVIPLPPKHEQALIATYLESKLSQLKTAIQNMTKLIAQLEEYRSALIIEAVAGKLAISK
jgi:type I restriction enzyme, S subunit